MAHQLIKKGFAKVYCLEGGLDDWKASGYPVEKKWTIKKECISCHTEVTPGIVSDWKASAHSKREVSCSVCHGAMHMNEEDVDRLPPVNADTCAMCHHVQGDQFRAGKHAKAWDAMKAMPTAHWQPMAMTEGMKGCGGCHKLGIKSQEEVQALKEAGSGFGLASCDACHTRHTFSVKEAKQPQACQTCHMGFDHPQWEMYSSSKHGVRYLMTQQGVLPDTTLAPTCQTCHMQEGTHEVRTAWGFLAVRLPMPEDETWANARRTILQALGVLDPDGKPTARLEVVKTADVVRLNQDEWLKERTKVLRACGECHSLNFAKGELNKGDQMIREADILMAEAIRIVAGLYSAGILQKPRTYAYLFPDLLAFHDAPTSIENRLFLMFMKHRMRTFQGTFHANPDYALWYGWSALQQDLTEIREMAETLRKDSKKN